MTQGVQQCRAAHRVHLFLEQGERARGRGPVGVFDHEIDVQPIQVRFRDIGADAKVDILVHGLEDAQARHQPSRGQRGGAQTVSVRLAALSSAVAREIWRSAWRTAGLWRPVVRALQAVPASVSSAMLAGLLAGPCLAPLGALGHAPESVPRIVLAWLIVRTISRPWAVPAALAVAVWTASPVGLPPDAVWTLSLPVPVSPRFDVSNVAGLALPLFVVAMLTQYAPAFGLLREHGYRTRPGPVLVCTGLASMVGALFGGLGVVGRRPPRSPRLH